MAGGAIAASIVGLASKLFGGLFGLRKEQATTIQEALKQMDGVNDSDKAQMAAASASIIALYSKGGILERTWRPTFMWVCMILIVARWFGYVPAGLDAAEVENIYLFMHIGLIGYLPMRSLDKWMIGFQIGGLLKEFIRKRL